MTEEKKYEYPSKNPWEDTPDCRVLEYRHKDYKLFMPVPTFAPDETCQTLENRLQKFWGEHCTLQDILEKATRSIGNNADNTFGSIIEACTERGASEVEIADELQKAIENYEIGKPRAAGAGQVRAVKAAAKEAGVSMADLIKAAAKMKEAGEL